MQETVHFNDLQMHVVG